MKTTTLLVAAAGIGQSVATFGPGFGGGFGGFKGGFGGFKGGFKGANPFACPDNLDNKCKDKQRGGFDWADLIPGNVDFDYDGFRFKGWQCIEGRGRKEISGDCGPDKSTNPFFESDDGFSLDEIEVFPEFDTDLEFVYEMPDGGQCKQRSRCKAGGSKVKNTQCGGAKKVTIVHPPQKNKPKPICKIRIPKINFNCGPPKTPKPPKETPPPVETPTPTPDVPDTPEETETVDIPGQSTPGAPESSEEPDVPESTIESNSPEEPTPSVPGVPQSTETVDIPGQTTPGAPGSTEEPDVPGSTIESNSPDVSTPGVPDTPETTEGPDVPGSTESPEPSEPIVDTITTTFITTSTIFTTETSTVTRCKPSIAVCPGEEETTVITITIPETTTVCPVTETITTTRSSTENNSPEVPTPGPEVPGGETPVPPKEEEPLPCPPVVPSCLNTWLFEVGCKDNTDVACFCPDSIFVKHIFDCIYAHGESPTVVSEAIVFFQGICAGHVPENPAIVTGVEPVITDVLTEAPKPTIGAGYTTVTVTVTTEVPCVENGVTIPNSFTTTTVAQVTEIPNVGFQTGSEDVVNVVPITPEPVSQPTPAPFQPTPGAPGTFISIPVATGTFGGSPLPSSTGPVEVSSGSRTKAGFGLAFAVVAGAAALL